MINIKKIISLMLIITLTATISFADGPHHHPDDHHHHHSSHHSYNDTRNAFLALLGITAFTTAIIIGANAASKSKSKKVKEKEIIEQHYEQVSQDLTLNETQQERIKVLLDASREKITPLREEKDLKSAALEQERAKENPNEATISNLENEISDLSRKIYKITQDTKNELKIILLPAQYQIIDDMKI